MATSCRFKPKTLFYNNDVSGLIHRSDTKLRFDWQRCTHVVPAPKHCYAMMMPQRKNLIHWIDTKLRFVWQRYTRVVQARKHSQ